jgi:hypothetical protein
MTPEHVQFFYDGLDRLRQLDQEEDQELFRVVFSSVSTAPWCLLWLVHKTRRDYLAFWRQTRTSLDPNG